MGKALKDRMEAGVGFAGGMQSARRPRCCIAFVGPPTAIQVGLPGAFDTQPAK